MTGATVVLHVRTQTGVDSFNAPIFSETTENVDNVLIGQPTTEEIDSTLSLYGKKIEYMLGIPKGDTHDWEDTIVEFWGRRYRTFGMTIQGIEANIPTPWHKKVRVERDG